ncbi:unnamed protein product [Kuraishia capsulata CBS 1993]|uniref:Inositol-pentakisphosphate 2-kinase n=1 Tax=Kuraishia capsulata CBS 1993 TaxID=1382522 RepID=W6ML10_9ASCO|nr:uncharacterized protein KUCA_T00003093001 [Kuraishia capsulata CBS 1993]CDK27116.1 unnamed protein product [Kuraishia capsulata CBS 1993]
MLTNQSDWIFLAKGNANAVFSYRGEDPKLQGLVLRLRLQLADSQGYIPVQSIVEYVNSKIRPSFKNGEIVDMSLVELAPGFAEALSGISHVALQKDEKYGILLPNILPEYERATNIVEMSKHIKFRFYQNDITVLELKPKWLYQLPAGVSTCRNCALERLRSETKRGNTGKSTGAGGGISRPICPLDLLSPKTLQRWTDKVCSPLAEHMDVTQLKVQLLHVLQRQSSIKAIFELQNENNLDVHQNIRNLKGESSIGEDLSLSMTMKDVTVFITFGEDAADIKIIDLDLKPAAKWSHWKTMEQKLVDSGFYDELMSPPCNREVDL